MIVDTAVRCEIMLTMDRSCWDKQRLKHCKSCSSFQGPAISGDASSLAGSNELSLTLSLPHRYYLKRYRTLRKRYGEIQP